MSAVATEQVNLHWQHFSSTVSGYFQKLRNNSDLFDVTLACSSQMDGPSLIKAHKLVLAASSPVLRHLVLNMEGSNNGMIYLSGIEPDHIKSALDFVYTGQANVEKVNLERFLQVAEELQIEGLVRAPDAQVFEPEIHGHGEESESKANPPKKRRKQERIRKEEHVVNDNNNNAEKEMRFKAEQQQQQDDDDEEIVQLEEMEEQIGAPQNFSSNSTPKIENGTGSKSGTKSKGELMIHSTPLNMAIYKLAGLFYAYPEYLFSKISPFRY